MRRLFRISSLLFLLPTSLFLAILFSGIAFAEEAAQGRLDDGRAYRTDTNGNQIVDYIAELEVSRAGLQRKVYALQDEVDELRKAKASAPVAPLKERDISTRGAPQASAPVRIETINTSTKCEPTAPHECGVLECSKITASLEAKLKGVRAELSRSLESQQLQGKVSEVASKDCSEELRQASQKTIQLDAELQRTQEENRKLSSRFEIAEREVALLESRLSQSSESGSGLEAELVSLREGNRALMIELSELKMRLGEQKQDATTTASLEKQLLETEKSLRSLKSENAALRAEEKEVKARVKWEPPVVKTSRKVRFKE